MSDYFVIDLGHEQRHGYIIGGRLPPSDPAFSPLVDVGYNRQDLPWRDEKSHLHTSSEEYFILLQGRLDLLIAGYSVVVNPYQLTGVRANVPHQITGGQGPIENFLIRVPGSDTDKVSLDSRESVSEITIGTPAGCIQIDLQQPHNDYLLGACLPPEYPHYSPHLDFTCVFGVNPVDEWRREQAHFHTQRTEFYFVLKGSLDFEIDGESIPVRARQVLGVRPGAVHKVMGGIGPVDVLFLRVPGGRGDKTPVES